MRGEHDGRFTEEHRVRLIRWLLRELDETTGLLAGSGDASRATSEDRAELDEHWEQLRRTIGPWLAAAEQRHQRDEHDPT